METQTQPQTQGLEEVKKLPHPSNLLGMQVTGRVNEIIKALRNIPQVETAEDKARLDVEVIAGQKALKFISDKRLSITRIIDLFKQSYTDAEKEGTAELNLELKSAVSRLDTYNREQLRKQREAEQKVRDEAAAELKRKRAPSSIAAVETKTQERLAEVAEAHINTGVATVWKGEVTDISLVPRKYLVVNQAAINADIKAGARQIPGVNIFEDVRRTGRA